jgi:hypothetical protein
MQLALDTFSPIPGAIKGVEPCLRCGSRDVWPEFSGEPYGLYCRSCQWHGPRASDADAHPDKAIAAWNDEARKVALARQMGLTVNLVQPPMEAEDVC